MKKISIVTPTFNEKENIPILYEEIKSLMTKQEYDYEHIIIDNCSTDGTADFLRQISKIDKKVKVIINYKNFGHIRSPMHAMLQSTGDACILMNSDFQDPVYMILEYINKWKEGYKIVLGQKKSSDENKLIFLSRKFFYYFIKKISNINLIENITGSGIYDKFFIEELKKINDPYPYLRGLIFELTDEVALIQFNQPIRRFGKSKNNFFTLIDLAILGIIKHSRLPLRMMTIIGVITSLLSLLIGIFYLIYKLLFWNSFEPGVSPLIIGFFFLGSVQILLLGFIGEYIGLILIHQKKIPLVLEKERINF
jgi:glycosyltransferase involved in cell wall biosynthesis